MPESGVHPPPRNGPADGIAQPGTIQDIARALGIHPSTVSRALSGGKGARVSAATIKQVRETAAKYGYVPNPWAASLRTKSTRVIGVIVPRLTDPLHAAIAETIESETYRAGYQTALVTSGDTLPGQQRKAEYLLDRRVDGLILSDAHRRDPFVRILATRGVPHVLVFRATASGPAVTVDEQLGGALVARHLWELGHRHIGVIGGMPYMSTAYDRRRGFLGEIARRGRGTVWSVESKLDVEAGEQACERLLREHPTLTAIFAVTDLLAIGAMAALRGAGRQVGRDVAVIGYDDLPLAARLPISLSSVHVPLEELAKLGVSYLVDRLGGGPGLVRSVTVEPRLLVRESSVEVTVPSRPAPDGRRPPRPTRVSSSGVAQRAPRA
jgi:LacI family transcriptional regulator